MTSRAEARSSYFPTASSAATSSSQSYAGMSPGLRRARQPFIVRNTLTGAGIILFAASVYFYSIKAVSQDDFSGEDVKLLQAEQEAKRKASASTQPNSSSSLLVGPSAAAASTSSVGDLRASQSRTMQAVVDLEGSMLGVPLGARDQPSRQIPRHRPTDYFALTTDRIFLGRHASRSGATYSLDKPGLLSDKPPELNKGDRRLV